MELEETSTVFQSPFLTMQKINANERLIQTKSETVCVEQLLLLLNLLKGIPTHPAERAQHGGTEERDTRQWQR